MLVCKMGDGLAVQLPADVIEALHLKDGDSVVVRAYDSRSVVVEVKQTPAEMLAAIRKMPRFIPVGYKFDREEANERR